MFFFSYSQIYTFAFSIGGQHNVSWEFVGSSEGFVRALTKITMYREKAEKYTIKYLSTYRATKLTVV